MIGVTLGLPGPWANSNYEPADHYSTKIGGLPDWPFPINTAIQALLECKTCGRNLCLISQVYAPISSKELAVEERVIYIFGCMVPQCDSHVWLALRVQKISSIEDSLPCCDDVDHTPVPSLSVSETKWHDELWSLEHDDDIDMEELGRALSEAAHVASTSKRQSNDNESSGKSLDTVQQAIDSNRPVIPCFYIYTQEEKFVRKVASENSKYPLPSVKVHEDNSEDHSQDETYEEENYEYDRALHADRTYLKFKKRVDEYPEQCFRYSYGGQPLLASGGAVNPGLCGLCGELRHYEMQLMPPLIYFLQEAIDEPENSSMEKFDWMTLLVFTCSKASTLLCFMPENILKP
ncbi:programmed cell death protein 2-like [Dorcoceras hygrometricum]|uniref:Programmed cell death protein 2-like n=1 Tax=Dorcoceras hygrometricum TaxID=472368 RepID=A0A2Z7B7M9_9LAMI|nr:programmed cell death protein 2-like [Dorcoceras hygrometricum]